MKLLIIRHGDPDYSIDSLTETGWHEAELLARRIEKLDLKDIYVSPLGRAKDTASLSLKALGRTAEEKDWLQEFPPKVLHPGSPFGMASCTWDWLPDAWTAEPRFFDRNAWKTVDIMVENGVDTTYNYVIREFDALLAEHGYVRDGLLYRAEKPNNDTLAFFCHFGLECVLLSHLMNVSPMVLWHGFTAAPTSVTTVITEERRPGIAYFRAAAMGDTSHLYAADWPVSPHARFCECYDNADERHD